jgi:hypothetical protein
MSGRRPFSDLKKDWSPERLSRNDAHQARLAAELASREQLDISHDELSNAIVLRI